MKTNTPQLVYWYGPKAPAPASKVQATGWPGPLPLVGERGPCLWRADRGRSNSAQHLTERTTHELIARLAIRALSDVPQVDRSGMVPRDPVAAIRYACHALAAHDARFTSPEKYDRVFNMARHIYWRKYDSLLAIAAGKEFEAITPKTHRLARLFRAA